MNNAFFIFKIGKDPALNRTGPRVFVLAIFEIEECYDVPEDKATLVKLLKKGIMIPFHKHWCLSCHQIPKVPITKLGSINPIFEYLLGIYLYELYK